MRPEQLRLRIDTLLGFVPASSGGRLGQAIARCGEQNASERRVVVDDGGGADGPEIHAFRRRQRVEQGGTRLMQAERNVTRRFFSVHQALLGDPGNRVSIRSFGGPAQSQPRIKDIFHLPSAVVFGLAAGVYREGHFEFVGTARLPELVRASRMLQQPKNVGAARTVDGRGLARN